MPRLEVPQEQVPQSAQPGSSFFTHRVIESSADTAARVGQTMEQYGQDIEHVSGRLGDDMQQMGNQYFKEATGAMNSAAYNKAYANAITEFSQAAQKRINTPYDQNGNPTYATMQSDIAAMGRNITGKYGSTLVDPDTQERFQSEMNRAVSNHELVAMTAQRHYLVQDSLSSLNSNITATTNAGIQDDPIHLGNYLSQGANSIKDAVSNGYLTPEEGKANTDKLRHDLYYGSAQLQITNNLSNAQGIINSQDFKNNLSPLERNTLLKQVGSAIHTQQVRANQQQVEQQKIIKDQQNSYKGDMELSMMQGNIGPSDIQDAMNKGNISHDGYVGLMKQYYQSQGTNLKNAQTNTSIASDIQQGNSLSNYSSTQINDSYNKQVTLRSQKGPDGQIQAPDLMAKASIAAQYQRPVQAFNNEIKWTMQNGSNDQIKQAVQAYNYLHQKSPYAAQGLDRQTLATVSYIGEQSKYTNLDQDTIIANAKRATNPNDEQIKTRNTAFTKEEAFKDNNLDSTIKNMYGIGSVFGRADIDDQSKMIIKDLLHQAYQLTGDSNAAQQMVKLETKGIIGKTSLNGKDTLMMYPPEDQPQFQQRGLTTKDLRNSLNLDAADVAKQNGIKPEDIKITSNELTSNSGQDKIYSLYYTGKDGKSQLPIINTATGQPVVWRPNADDILKQKTDSLIQQRDNMPINDNMSKYQQFQNRLNQPFGNTTQVPHPGSYTIDTIKKGIASVETGNDPNAYSNIGQTVHGDDHALGKYQVLASNLPAWSKEAIGRVVTPQEFLNSPSLQEQIVGHKLDQLMQQYPDARDVISVWHSGRPLQQATNDNATDSVTGMKTSDYVNKALNEVNNIPDEAKHDTGDYSVLMTKQRYGLMSNGMVSVPQEGYRQDNTIGSILAAGTQHFEGTKYVFGSKDAKSGGIDCSGWVAQNTVNAMNQLNQQAGHQIYDVNRMQSLMNQGAAYQISSIAKMTGYMNENDVRTGNMPSGTLIGIRRRNVPSWAAGRPNGISHIVQVINVNGQKYISQSAGSMGGVSMLPLNEFLQNNKDSQLFAVNPFNLVSTNYQARN